MPFHQDPLRVGMAQMLVVPAAMEDNLARAVAVPVATAPPFLLYAVGMGPSILVVSVVAALAGSTLVATLRRRTPAVMRAAGWLMILAGLNAALYGLAEVLPRYGIDALASVVDVTGTWQGALTRAIVGWGTPMLAALAVLAAIAVAWIFGVWRRRI